MGYTYAAGALHFSPEEEYRAEEITAVWEAAGALHVRLLLDDGTEREEIIRRPGD